MTKEIFVLPVPSTSLVKSPRFEEIPGRISEIICEYEGAEAGQTIRLSLIFGNRYAVKITNDFACSIALRHITYDKVVDLGETDWLESVNSNLAASIGLDVKLKHLGIFFDDECLYEFICESFQTQIEASRE
jgi:hypothetical protein